MLNPVTRKYISSFLLKERGGNFGMMTAILLPMSIGAAGVAIDLTSAMQAKNNLQNLTDAAALATASAIANKKLTEDAGKAFGVGYVADNYMNQQEGDGASGADATALRNEMISGTNIEIKKITSEHGDVSYSVTVSNHHSMKLSPLAAMIGKQTIEIAATSTAQASMESKNPISMFLVLDRSGSMAWETDTINKDQPKVTVAYECGTKNARKTCYREEDNYVIKIDALKTAASSLLDTIAKADPDKKYARIGAVSYNSSMDSTQGLQWGTTTARSYTNALVATGGTSSTKAFEKAYLGLNDASENAAHKGTNGKTPQKFIVFMTDGDNNYVSDDTATINHCTSAKTAGIDVYSVAFMAPTRGQDLLKKCSTNEGTHYFEAKNAEELVKAFKEIGEKASQSANRLTN